MNEQLLRQLIAEAALAPSVHNVQPARWRIGVDQITLLEDLSRRLPVADPAGHDAAMSLGAAGEGLRVAASRVGLRALTNADVDAESDPSLRPVATYRFEQGGASDPLAALVEKRQSWRGKFAPTTDQDRKAAQAISADDAAVLADPADIEKAAGLLDRASWRFMSRTPFRREIVSWMRLSPGHPQWPHDGLNADAMAMTRVEALGAGFVLGGLFSALKTVGLAKPLLAEAAKTRGAAAIVLFHRPADESPFLSGAHFYRLWLRIEQLGFGAAVLAALADDPDSSAELAAHARLPADHRLVSAFRVGRRPTGAHYARARLPLDTLIVR